MDVHPPKWADRFLRWYCHPELIEEIQGDVHELFERRARENKRHANWRFIWDVFRFFRWSNFKHTTYSYQRSNSFTMFRNYLKIGFRTLTKHWSISMINILGLALAIGWALTSFIFVDMMNSMDQYHSNKENIYQVINYVESDDGTRKWGDSPLLLGPELAANHAQVENMFRMEFRYADVRHEKKVFHEFLVFADPGYFTEMDFPFLVGSDKTLETRDQMVISYAMAEKYFADQDPIGQQLSIKFSNGKVKSFMVGAVLDKYPYNTSMGYHFYLPMENFFDLGLEDSYDWSYFGDATFIVLQDGTEPYELLGQFDPYIKVQNDQKPDWKITSFELIPLTILPRISYSIEGNVAGGSHPAGRIALTIIAVLLVVLACFNYMNIAIAAATRRLKEIALRKVVGSQRSQIVWQFLTENYLQVFFALILGTVLSYFAFVPLFNTMIPISIPFEFSSVPTMILTFVGLLLFVGLTAGAYPSFYISRFQPVAIFRGNESFGRKNRFSQILTGVQLFIAFHTIVGCFIFADNAIYMGQKEWGYESQGILAVEVREELHFTSMRDFADQNADVVASTGARHHVGHSAPLEEVRQLEKDMRAHLFDVGKDYPRFMNLQLVGGAYFNEDIAETEHNELIVNKKFVEKMGWTTGLDQQVVIDSTTYRVVGVTTDFQYENYFAYSEMMPVAMRVVPESEFNYVCLKVPPSHINQLDEDVEAAWAGFAPDDPLNKWIQAHIFDDFYQENKANITIILFISGLATVLACLGLFGLLSFNIQKRLKEFSVRKVLGASAINIVRAVSKQYIWILGVAFLVAAPSGFFLIDMMIQSIYPDPKDTSVLPFVLAILVMMITIALTVSGQIYRATHVNPADNLRSE